MAAGYPLWHLLLTLQNAKPESALAVGAEPCDTYQNPAQVEYPSLWSLILDGVNCGIDDYQANQRLSPIKRYQRLGICLLTLTSESKKAEVAHV